MEIPIIYEDDSVLVINKPAGLMVHGDGRSEERTLADWLEKEYTDIKNIGESWVSPEGKTIYRPGIVHRLDRDTSGVMIVVKTQDSFNFIKEQFQERKVEKTYRAFVYGNIKEDSGIIDKPIGKSRKNFRQWSAQPGARGLKRDAVTDFEVLSRNKDKSICYVELKPKTGRTHQLRVHMKAIHHPIVCDSLYAPDRDCKFGMKSIALHAYTLKINLPLKGEMSFKAPLPKIFTSTAKMFEGESVKR